LLVPPRDVEQLTNACISLIDNPQRRREMGQAGRRFVERYYHWPDNTRLMSEIYRATLDGTNPRSVPIFIPGREPDLVVPPAA
jgi:glycosyltransferase involved in cell wall biosynthesis